MNETLDAIGRDIERLSAKLSQSEGERAIMIKRAATSAPHEQERVALTVRQLDREQERRRQQLNDLQRQKNILAEKMSHLEVEKSAGHRKKIDKLVGNMDDFVMEAEERSLAAEEDRAYLQDIDDSLDQTASGNQGADNRTNSILGEINAQKELLEDERSDRIKARLRDQQTEKESPRKREQHEEQEEESY